MDYPKAIQYYLKVEHHQHVIDILIEGLVDEQILVNTFVEVLLQ